MQDSNSTLAALAVIARHYGIEFRVDELRRSFMLDEGEPSAAKLAGIGRELGLEIKPLRLTWRQLPRLRKVLPAILRLKDGGALLLDAVKDDKGDQTVVVRDPHHTDAQAIIDESQLAALWDGDIILVKRHFAFADEEKPFGIAWLAARVLEDRRMLRDVVISALINAVFVLMPILVVRIVLDKVMPNHSSATLVAAAIFFGVVLIFEMILLYLRSRFLETIATRIDGKLFLYIMDKLVRLPIEFFERNSVGRIMSNLYQVRQIRSFITGEMFAALLDLVTAIVVLPILFFVAWQLALFAMLWTTVVFLIVLAFLRPIQRRYRRVVAAETEKATYMTESIYGMRTIKSLALENRRRLGWDPLVAQAASDRFDLGRMSVQLRALTAPFERLITTGSIILGGALYLYSVGALNQPQIGLQTAGTAAMSASIQPGMLVAFMLLAGLVVHPLMRVARLLLELSELRGSISQVALVANAPPEETRAGTGLRLPILGNIAFQDVNFRYSSGTPLALDDVSFTIPPGTVLGIMGRSGSGKTTITRLLQGLNQSYEGVIRIDGMDLREMDLHYLRTHIGVVAQENFLFTGTIRENIGMARPDASLAEIVRAAQLAGAEEFIERLPGGYNTVLHEGATNLSGGQRQRLAIARALILDPPVLILDEATSALDAESEAIINANLRHIARGRTIICVSHRLSMLVSSHAILVLEKGKVYDIGTHDELVKRCDIYRHMWFEQNRHIDPGESHGPIAVIHSAKA
jgi:ATP-binding cassette, subfamily B, bacterial HlyB/CyaB